MVTLKEREAVEYLERAKNCIYPGDSAVPLQLVRKMLEVESAFIRSLVFDGETEMARVTVDAAGFPELQAWQNDISCAYSKYQSLLSKWRKRVLPLIQQYIDARPGGILEEGRKIAASMQGEQSLMAAFSVSDDQKAFFQNPNPEILYKDPTRPGLLLSKNRTIFGEQTHHVHNDNVHDQFDDAIGIGLKYLDITGAQRVQQGWIPEVSFWHPAILYVLFCPDARPNVALLTAKQENRWLSKVAKCEGIIHVYNTYVTHCNCNKLIFSAPESPVNFLQKLHPNLQDGFLNMDMSGLDGSQRGMLFNMLPELDSHINGVASLLRGYAMNDHFQDSLFSQTNLKLSEQYEKILNFMPSDELRITYQLIVAGVAKGIQDEIESLEKYEVFAKGTQPALSEPEKKRNFLTRIFS